MIRKILVALALGGAVLTFAPQTASANSLGGPSTVGSAGVLGVELAQYYGGGYGYSDNSYYHQYNDYHPHYYRRHHYYDDDSYSHEYRRGY